MRLLKVGLEGIRRFEKTDALLVADRMVAVVGPNEAGKTSLLQALRQIHQIDSPLPRAMHTRQCSTEPRIRALFELDSDDRGALDGIHDTAKVRRLWVHRYQSETRWQLEPSPKRDLTPRQRVLSALDALDGDMHIDAAIGDDGHPLTEELIAEARAAAASDEDSLSDSERSRFSALAEALSGVPEVDHGETTAEAEHQDPGEYATMVHGEIRTHAIESLKAAAEAESKPAPWQSAIAVLEQRIPTFVEFDNEDRDLRAEYDLTEVAAHPPPALENVAELAGLDVAALFDAINNGDPGTVRLLRENANARLREVFESSYAQSDVRLELDTSGTVLQLLVRSEGGEDFVELSERSAGFQWFVALIAFLARHRIERPIVLIDEIETHLHYTAQADVVDVLNRQQVSQQVIYTTHSAGALPPDLGQGVRAVVPIPGRQRSEVKNSFWTSGPGFTPLLFGLGAAALPFAIPKYVLLTEGASDCILLPSLLRQATGLEELAFRVAPGLANTPPHDLHLLDAEGGRVVYLVDGDAGGRELGKHLEAAGIDSSRILDLEAIAASEATPEDFIQQSIYAEAVNAEGEPYWDGNSIRAGDLPDFGRSRAVEDWCSQRGLALPSKVRVAQRVVEKLWLAALGDDTDDHPTAIVADSARPYLEELHRRVSIAMRLEGS